MNPPIRNWNQHDMDEESKHYTYTKPNYGENEDKEQKTKIYKDDDAILNLLQKVENEEYSSDDLNEFLDKYKRIEKFLISELKIKEKDNKS